MSPYVAFRRQAVDPQVASQLRTITFAAPTRGIIQNENEDYMQPGGCIVLDNWAPTMRGVKLRGGSALHCDVDASWPPPDFGDRPRHPIISAFEYEAGSTQRMFAAQQTKLWDVTTSPAVQVADNRTSGNYATAQMTNAAGGNLGTSWLIAVNEAGDYPLRYDGDSWELLNPTVWSTGWTNNTFYPPDARVVDGGDSTIWKALVGHTSSPTGTFAQDRAANPGRWTSAAAGDNAAYITGPIGSQVQWGNNLTYVWKYRSRLYFIEGHSMNAHYLDINAVGGALKPIPLAGAASRGGHLMFGASWSLDAGDGLDEKCLFVTNLGEVLIFTGSNPGDPNNWRQQGRYQLSAPLGMNAHLQVGGDMLVATVDGIIPLSQAITKDAGQLELAMLTRTIKPLWRAEVAAKRAQPWTMKKWDEYGAIFIAVPGGKPGERLCLLANNATGAWARFLNWDATCFLRLRGDMFFGTQHGFIMQADRTGYDMLWDDFDYALVRRPYVCTMVGGWEIFGASANQIVWLQARATFKSSAGEPFQPQLAATIDYQVKIPLPPNPGPDPGLQEVWDQGLWDVARWDQPANVVIPVRNTLWVSIGETGYAHAPIVQVQVDQQATPSVELVAISAVYEPAGVNV